MWTVDGYRVQKLESGDLVLTMLREYRFNPFWCTESMVGSTRFVRLKPGCKWGMYPDTHGTLTVNQGAEELNGHRPIGALMDASNDADKATPGFEECSSCPSQMNTLAPLDHLYEDTIPAVTQRMLDQHSDEPLDGDALAMVRGMRTSGESRGLNGVHCGRSTDDGCGDSYVVRVSMSDIPRGPPRTVVPVDTAAEHKEGAKFPVCGARSKQSKDACDECLERSAKSNLGKHAQAKGDDAHMIVVGKLKEADPDLDN